MAEQKVWHAATRLLDNKKFRKGAAVSIVESMPWEVELYGTFNNTLSISVVQPEGEFDNILLIDSASTIKLFC